MAEPQEAALALLHRIALAIEHMAGLTGHVPAAPTPASPAQESTGQTEESSG